MYVHHVYDVIMKVQRGIESSEVVVRSKCEPPHGYWELNPGPHKSSKGS